MWTAHALDKKVVNERPNGGSYERGMKGKECIVWTSQWPNPKLCEHVEHVDVVTLGLERLIWEHREHRKD